MMRRKNAEHGSWTGWLMRVGIVCVFALGSGVWACKSLPWPDSRPKYVVYDAAGLLSAIGSNRRIYLQPNLYNLSGAWRGPDRSDTKPLGYDGEYEQIVLNGLSNLDIIGAGPGSTRVVIEEEFPHVLFFKNSENIAIRGIELEHQPPSGAICLGAALGMENVKNARVSDVVLKGSGTFGLWLERTENVSLTDSVITECTRGIVFAHRSRGLRLADSVFVNNVGGFHLEQTGGVLLEDSRVLFNRSIDSEAYTKYIFGLKQSMLVVKDTRFERNVARGMIDSDRKKVRMEGIVSDRNRWVRK